MVEKAAPTAVPTRWIDAGAVPPYRTQTIYHGLAHSFEESTPDTVIVCAPASPYVCVGYHQDLEHEVDTGYCREIGIPVVRRELGGGAVYLDRDQLFVQWVMRPERLPRRIEDRFRLFTLPIIETYREFGVEATFRPPNDIHVGGRKICGTGAAQVGDAEVLVGNFLFDFDCATMARILNLTPDGTNPGTKLRRDEIRQSLERYMTTFRREIANVPDPERVRDVYREKCEDALGEALDPADLTPDESTSIEAVERRFQSDAFRLSSGGMKRHGVKIHEDIWVRSETIDSIGGPIYIVGRVDLADGTGTLDQIRIEGSGPAPETLETANLGTARMDMARMDMARMDMARMDMARMETGLRGVRLERAAVEAAVRAALGEHGKWATIDAWVGAVLRLSERSA